ncbi:type I restriction endonuclease subunit S [Clostridium sp. HMSC19D02]|uniref:Type I restriction modification DNA specificity domain protein (Modular protein) n=4 Tax=Clostridioides difficile TaxID=1496 RepID=A0A069AFB4_CLODI|nr:restriction endonuclease subunit S [Clostridioides difficile]OFU11312.1 type I restriction endonuclease subunit S [Clostridium sp. HMSC19D02]AXU80596.1 type I restriction-modification system subunit S [Clostridioides difficile]AXU84227.1 type I restriction-modification system subunit S [Clostridioides difficile]EGT3636765.1 restriction endonuclease subunit S [Clostridioides difficile]EGT3660676.1 restriction endonuclease subunit S [Clostridioides difficile]
MEYIKLNELCYINIGKTPSRNTSDYWGSGNRWLSISDLKEKYILKSKEEITDLAVEKANMKLVPKNTVVMSFKLSIGRVAILKEDMFTNEAIANFQIKNNELITYEYLYYALRTLNFNNTDRAVMGATLNKSKLNDIKIPYFTICIQNKMVEVLNKAQELINKRKEQIEALDELVKSRFIEMFGNVITNSKDWDTELLGEISNLKAGKNIKAKDIYEKNSHELYPCYGGNGLRGYVKMYSHKGTFNLIGRQGALCGNVKYVNGKFYATEHAVVVQPKVDINSYWLYFTLKELDLNRLSTGAAQPGLTVGKLNEVEIPKVPVYLQNKFVDFVRQIDKLKSRMEDSLKELENNFNSLMQKAFKGELFN